MILNKFLKKNKVTKYFLEIIDDDDDKDASESEKLEKPQPVAPTTSVETIKDDSSQLQPSETQVKAKPAKTQAKTQAKATKTEEKSAPAPAPAPNYEPPEWVKAIKNYSGVSTDGEGNSVSLNNFAGKYVSNNVASSRRRPGGSLNKFKDMASKVNK